MASEQLNQATRLALTCAMNRLAAGDRKAFDAIYASAWPAIRRFAAQRIGEEALAEDLAQQTLLKVFSRASTFNRDADALNWMLGIAANECRSYLRKAGKHVVLPFEDTADIPSVARTPAEEAEIASTRASVNAVLKELRPREIETISTVIYESQRPKIPAATFRKRWQRALQSAKAAWQQMHRECRACGHGP